jgi:hypothetical protein
MGTGRPKVALILADDERQRLDSLAHRSRSVPALARRARIILACAGATDCKVERRFPELTMKQIRGGSFRTVPQLRAAIQEFVHAHPFETTGH